MKYREFGKTGLKVSCISLGGFPFAAVNKDRDWDPYSTNGKIIAIKTINTALDMGINFIDTGAMYGDGHSERLIGEVLKTRRNDCYVATKVKWQGADKDSVIKSVENSLKRLNCDYVDLLQLHGQWYTHRDYEYIMNSSIIEGLEVLKSRGLVRFTGLTAEEAWTTIDFIETGFFDSVQVGYNFIYQSAALHMLDKAKEQNMGVSVMRAMTSGVMQNMLKYLEPKWIEAANTYEFCLKFVLSDSRVHMANVGMRWPEEVKMNVDFIDNLEPNVDIADMPRTIGAIYSK